MWPGAGVTPLTPTPLFLFFFPILVTWLPIKLEGSKPQTKGVAHTVNTDCMLGVHSLVYSLVCSEVLLTLITGKATSKSSSCTELVSPLKRKSYVPMFPTCQIFKHIFLLIKAACKWSTAYYQCVWTYWKILKHVCEHIEKYWNMCQHVTLKLSCAKLVNEF